MRSLSCRLVHAVLSLTLFLLGAGVCLAQQAPPASAARILLMPRKLITGERATLAVLDVNGRLTPGVNVKFSDGETVTTDTTGRALFVAPLNPGTFYGSIEGRRGRVSSSIQGPMELPSSLEVVTGAPRVASISDRFELTGHGFCGDADANHVTIGGLSALVLASSPLSLTVLPPLDLEPGPAQVKLTCGQKAAEPFTTVFVRLVLETSSGTLAPGERRALVVRAGGTSEKVNLEARNLAPDVAELVGGVTVRASTSGGSNNVAKFELTGKKHGSFVISIRLLAPLFAPQS